MKISRMVPAGIVAAFLFSAWGCGGGGGEGTSDQNALVEGRSAMNALAAEQKPANSQTLQQTLDLFLKALQQDPGSSEAHFGAAVCLVGRLAEEVDGGATENPLPPAPPPAPGKPGEGSGGTVSPPSPPAPPTDPNATPPSPPAPPNGRAALAVSDPVTGDVPPSPPGVPEPAPLPRHRTLGLLWNLDNNLANPFMLLHMLAPITDLRLGFAAYYGYPHDNAARRQKILDGLNTVADHLAKVEADPNFSVTIPDVDAGGKTVTVGLPEVDMLDAYVQSLRAKVALSLAYVRDSGIGWIPPTANAPGPITIQDGGTGSSGSASTGSGTVGSGSTGGGTGTLIQPLPISLDKNSDGKLTPDEYLPPSPYLTLRDAKLLTTAQQAITAVVDRENKGIEGVLARPATGSFLIPNVAAVQKSLTQIRDKVLPLIQQAATGPFTIEVPRWNIYPLVPEWSNATKAVMSNRGDMVFASPGESGDGSSSGGGTGYMLQPLTLKVNLAAWFANPPADLKVFAPTFTLNADGWPDLSKTLYPDKTFGGLFPDGSTVDLPF
jgi:hypothetical protein